MGGKEILNIMSFRCHSNGGSNLFNS